MKLSYSSSNFTFHKFILSLFVKNGKEETIKYFKTYTDKKYILLTSSCRSALFLAYCSIKKKGKIITSPLTCAVAIEPILRAGNRPVFADINPDSLVIKTSEVASLIDKDTIAIQAIHLGGVLCEMASLKQIAEKNKIYLIEDCAQGFIAPNQFNIGKYSDIACFTLSKNLYGIGGGILATNDPEIYNEAFRLQNDFPAQSKLVILSRILRNLIETYNNFWLSNILLSIMFRIKNLIRNSSPEKYNSMMEAMALTKELVRPDNMLFKVSSIQQVYLADLHKIRKKIGSEMDARIQNLHLKIFSQTMELSGSYVKYYCTTSYDCRKLIPMLNDQGIEAKHLEAKFNKTYQARFDYNPRYNQENSIINCLNYLNKHDLIVSLPCREDFSERKFDFLFDSLKKSIQILSKENSKSW
jgi:dTDP-4-amino-4,6-dideoxygalactose transaminase